jgi:hypothetical protein
LTIPIYKRENFLPYIISSIKNIKFDFVEVSVGKGGVDKVYVGSTKKKMLIKK